MDYVLTAETGHIDTNPYGFYLFACDYFRAGEQVWRLDCGKRLNYPAYFLFTRSIELTIKSLLLASKEVKINELKSKCKHDFDRMIEILTPDLKKILMITPKDENDLLILNQWYKISEKKFEYYSLMTSGLPFIETNYPKLPELDVLRNLNIKFFNPELEKYILSNS